MKSGHKAEVIRKSIHMATAFIPLAVWYLPPAIWRWPLIGLTLAILFMDLWRLGDPRFGLFFSQMLGPYLRRHEEKELLGSTYLAISCLLSALLFPKPIAVAVMGYLILGDGIAGLIGKNWGRHGLAFRKTIEGTSAGFLANLLVGVLVFGEAGPVLIGALVASLVELMPLPLDDNFAIPIVAGLVLWVSMF